MIDLYLFRHGECDINTRPEFVGGRTNQAALTQGGKKQAEQLGIRLKKENIKLDFAYASPALRAMGTAEIVCEIIGFPKEKIIIDNRLQELDQGEWQGKIREQCYTAEVMKRLDAEGWNFKAPGGESRKEVEDRMVDFLETKVLSKFDKNKKKSFAIFGHGVAIKCLLRHILNFDQAMTYKVLLSNTSITQLRFTEKGWFVERINDGAHTAESEEAKAYQNWVYGRID